MRRIYHTMHFEVHDEKALHEFVRKHAEPEEFAAMEQLDASQVIRFALEAIARAATKI